MNADLSACGHAQVDATIAVRPEELAELLRLVGVEGIELATIRRHIEAGCPVGPDGQLDLVVYLAWLLTDECAFESTESGSASR